MPRHQYKNKFNKKQDNVLLPEPNYPTVASSEHSNTDIVWENNIKTNFMKMILAFKEERSKYETVHLFLPVLFHTIGFKDVQTHTTGNTHCIVT